MCFIARVWRALSPSLDSAVCRRRRGVGVSVGVSAGLALGRRGGVVGAP